MRNLQTQLDATSRKSKTAETLLQNMTEERDSAVSQLSVAYVTIEELKAENESLVARLQQQTNDKTPHYQSEAALVGNDEPNIGGIQIQHQPRRPTRHRETEDQSHEDVFDVSSGPKLRKTGERDETSQPSLTQTNQKREQKGPGSLRKDVTTKAKKAKPLRPMDLDESSKNLTYLSFLDSGEVAQLRKTLERERVERKQRQNIAHISVKNDTTRTQFEDLNTIQSTQQSMPRKSSLKDITSRSENAKGNPTTLESAMTEGNHHRHHSEPSVLSTRSRRRALNQDNLTSAFIVPDITIRRNVCAGPEIPELSKENRAVLQDLENHEEKDCLVCLDRGGVRERCDHNGKSVSNVAIPKPTPVSDRIPAAGPFDEEPTMRPTQEPGPALATVIKGLEEEIAHFKIDLAKFQTLYNGHDPALSKRKRKAVADKMIILTKEIDRKADQVYALYDVLEGQKSAGHEMTQQEIEVTLHSIGVDKDHVHLRGGLGNIGEGIATKSTSRAPWDLASEDGADEELPWEGIESTANTNPGRISHFSRN